MWRKILKSTRFWLVIVILLQAVVYVIAGASKAYIHMDEAYSLALVQYDKIDITENEDFYNTWHTAAYYQDYLAVQEKDRGDWWPVYENQKNDVHPPLYYWFLRLATEWGTGRFSKWPGIILNILIMAGCTVLLYLIFGELFRKEQYAEWKALTVTLGAGLTVAAISTAVYIRMYGLLTLMVLLTLWLHLKLQEQKQPKWSWYVAISVVAVLGVLTQYYYLFFLAGLGLVMSIRYIRQKRWRELGRYCGSLMIAGGLVLLIWPHILQHMFFGYRGQGALANFLHPGILLGQLWKYILIVDYNVFHRTLLFLILGIIAAVLCKLFLNLAESGQKSARQTLELIMWPTVTYFVLAAVASPFVELRYVMPICGLSFGLVMYAVYKAFQGLWTENVRNRVMVIVMAMILIVAPVQIGLGWMRIELLYRDRQAVMTAVTENSSAPILYFITTENNRFLDNILLFAEAKESYLALDLLEPTAVEVAQILQGRDLNAGLFVFVSGNQDQDQAIEAVQRATKFEEVKFIQGINTCNVYYLR